MLLTQFEKTLQHLLQRKPFKPFLIEFDDGEQWLVGKASDIMYYGGGSTAIYFRSDGSFDFVHCEAVQRLLELTPQPVV